MLKDQKAIEELQAGWEGVVRMRERMQLLCVATFAGGAFTAPALAKVVYNLPLLLAFDVLRQSLQCFRNEGHFVCRFDHLGKLMDSAKSKLAWLDWQGLRDGVVRRNDVAHDGVLFDAKTCISDIEQIENQLREWKIIGS